MEKDIPRVRGTTFEEKERLDIHKKVHGRKAKISKYGSPEFNQDRLRGQQIDFILLNIGNNTR